MEFIVFHFKCQIFWMKNTAKLLNQKCEYPSKNLPLINSLCPFSCPAQPLLFPDIPEWHPVSWSCSWHWFLPSRPDSSLAWGQRGSRSGPAPHWPPVWPLVGSVSPLPLVPQRGCSVDRGSAVAGWLSGSAAGLAPRPARPLRLRFLCPLPFALASSRPFPTLLLNTFLFLKWLIILLL